MQNIVTRIFGLVILASAMAACNANTSTTTETQNVTETTATATTTSTDVKLTTNHGDIIISLNNEKAPISAANFVEYVESGHFSGTIFHRVIPGFMVQGGGFDADMNQKPARAPIQNEAKNGLKNDRGTLAMARTQDPHSASSQFFINVVDNDFLNFTAENTRGWGYAVFGEVKEGMDVVDKIVGVPSGNNGAHQNVPTEPVIIEKAELIK